MNQERFVFVGCVHQASLSLLRRLDALAANPPQYLVFCGDVTGSEKLEEFKRLFYNYVYNRAHNELGFGTGREQLVSEKELLNYVGPTPPEPGLTLGQGYRLLHQFVLELESQTPHAAHISATGIPDSEVAASIIHIARDFEYFGPWVKTLSEPVRRGVVATIKDDATKLATAVKPLQDAGTKVVLVCGNWDNAQSTRDGMVGEGIEVFDTLPFYHEHGWTIREMMDAMTTKHALLVMVPYWELPQWSRGTDQRLSEITEQVRQARATGKTVLIVGHNEPNWAIHNLKAPDPFAPLTGTRAQALANFDRIIAAVMPDEVVYPHQHNPLVDGDGKPVGLNAKYLLQVTNGVVKLVTEPPAMGEANQIVASYIPFQRFGELTLTADLARLHPRILGGSRNPVFVS